MSSTYQQSSDVSPDLLARDPDNRLLARAPRLRLPPFVIRDQALASSGLLVEILYGEPVKPYMPPNIWSEISIDNYERDQGDNLYRRSIYTFWRRTIPPPMMMTFNASDREVCTMRQSRTNTPLQALTMMNNVAFVEASRMLAERMIRGGGELPKRIDLGFRALLGRAATRGEIERLTTDYAHYRSEFDIDSAEQLLKVGDKPRDPDLGPVDLAATTMIASTILNLDETLTRE